MPPTDKNNVDESLDGQKLDGPSTSKSDFGGVGGTATENYFTMLIDIFPDISPIYLGEQAHAIGNNSAKLEAFIFHTLENNSGLPTRKDYGKVQSEEMEILKIRNMVAEDYLSQYEDPHTYFRETRVASESYKAHTLHYLVSHFQSVTLAIIRKVTLKHRNQLVPSFREVEELAMTRKGKKLKRLPPTKPEKMDIDFYKAYCYLKCETQIRSLQDTLKIEREKVILNAKNEGIIFECQICFDEDCLLTEVVMCEKGCMFCRDCVRRSIEVQIGENINTVTCLANCGESISIPDIQRSLPKRLSEKLFQKKQLEEIQAAGLDDLVQCPACCYATVMPDPEDKVLVCANTECGKSSCRLCGEDSHVPLSCDEVEKNCEVVARTKVENAMTDAMIRACVKCGNRFFKEEGCNKMTCKCGQTMCYLCRQPIDKGYAHYYGQGASPVKGKCPLWSDNVNLHKAEVLKAAEVAKGTVGFKTLKHDPTKDLVKPPEGFDPTALHAPPPM